MVLVLGCSKAPEVEDPHPRAGSWHAVDLHVHSSIGSNDTDGLSPMEDVVSVARERGLSMVIITDHSNSAGSMGCASGDVEDCPNQGPEFPAITEALEAGDDALEIGVGVEISPVASLETTSEPTGHIGCIPSSLRGFEGVSEPVIDRPAGAVDGGTGIAWCHNNDGFAVLNHPFTLAGWLNYDWSSMDYDAIEVFNGGARFDAGDWDAVQAWACDVSNGRDIIPVGGSDSHRAATPTPPEGPLDQAIGFPTTWVWRTEGSEESLLDALRAGRTVIADPRTHLNVWAESGNQTVGPGERITSDDGEVVIHVEVNVEHAELTVEIVDLFSGACTADRRLSDQEPPQVDPSVLYSEPLIVGETHTFQEVFAVGDVERLVVWVRPRDEIVIGHDGIAIASPIDVGRF